MTFSQFVELLPMAFGEEDVLTIQPDALSAINTLGRTTYTTRSGFAVTVEKSLPEERCAVRLRANIAFVHPQKTDAMELSPMLTYLQYAIATSKLSIAKDAQVLERQVSLFDLTPSRVETEVARFCKNCFCALTMLEYSPCPVGAKDKMRRVVMPAINAPNRVPDWANLSSMPSSLTQKPESAHGPAQPIDGNRVGFANRAENAELMLFPLSAKSHQLSHLHQSDNHHGALEAVQDWTTLLRKTSYFLGDTPANISHVQVFYDVEATRGFWYRMSNGAELYFLANPINDGDGDVSIAARIKTLDMNPAGATQMTSFVSAYNRSPYVGTLSFDTDSTLTLWRAMNLQSSQPGEVKRSMQEFAAAVRDIDEKVTAMTHYIKVPFCPYIGVRPLSKPQKMHRMNEPSFRESLLTTLQDFGVDGKFAGLDLDAIRSIDIKSISAAALRDICLQRLTRFNYHWALDIATRTYKVALSARNATPTINNMSQSIGQTETGGLPSAQAEDRDFASI
ncbi:hypothetical protein [Robbsia sp. KACC 23696]|uniref:hypothetical protein n=1 Tax=Robbsia sp. KACC 23696 TaxID=3149231 RepID=UPI00325AD9D8